MEPNEVYDFGGQSRMLRSLDTQEIAAGSVSLEDTWTDYLQYGITSAVTSSVVGLLNTGVALGEVIGIADKESYFDESASVNSLLGADAQSFYDRHKTGIDVVGFVAGSLVPGLGAIRALRALQTAGKVSSPLGAATGLRNPDMLLNSAAVESAKRYALETTTAAPNWFSTPMIKAYAQGYKQQVAEAGVFEAAVLVTMNQNATLNPDDLGYFDAIGDQFWDATKFAALGGVLGGTIDAFRAAGAVRKFGASEWERTAEYGSVKLSPYFDNLSPGSKILDLGRAAAERAELEKQIDGADWFAKKQFNAGQAQLKSAMLKTFGEANSAGHEGLAVLEDMVTRATPEQLESMSTVLSGLEGIANVSVADAKGLAEFYNRSRAPSIIARGEDLQISVNQIVGKQEEFSDLVNRLTGKEGESQFPFNTVRFETELNKSMTGAAGLAVSGGDFREISQSYNVRIANTGSGQVTFIPEYTAFNEESLKRTYETSKKYSQTKGVNFDMSYEDFESYAMLHELGHLKNNSLQAMEFIQNNMQKLSKLKGTGTVEDLKFAEGSKAGRKYELMRNLVEASLEGREVYWLAKFRNGGQGMSRQQKVDTIMNELTTPGWARRELNYLGDPAELLADGAAFITNPKTREIASKKFPILARFFDAQGSLAKAWNPTKAYYNSRTKEVSTSYLPGIRDVDSGVTIKTTAEGMKLHSAKLNKTFTYSSDLFSQGKITAAMTSKVDYQDYDAAWTMADSMKAEDLLSKSGEVRLGMDNLPSIEKLSRLYEAGDAKIVKAFDEGKVVLTSKNSKLVQPTKIEPIIGSGNKLNATATLDNLPPVASGFTRVYRASSPTVKFDDVFNSDGITLPEKAKGMKGEFYTTDIMYADYYRATYGKDANLSYLDIPKSYADATQVSPAEFIIDLSDARRAADTNSVVSPGMLPDLIKQRKSELRDQLAISKVGYNEHQIAKMLNIDLPHAMGDLSAKDEGWRLLGVKDFSKPEVFTMKYNHKTIKDYDGAVMNQVGVSMLNDAVKSQNQTMAAQLTGDLYTKLPEIPDYLMGTVNPFASRAGMINNLRSEMGTLREKAQYIGKLVQQKTVNLANEVDASFVAFSSMMNKPEARGLRFEFANIDNILRREHYYLAKTDGGENFIVRKDKLMEAYKGQGIPFDVEMLQALPNEIISTLRGVDDTYAPGAVKLGDEVAQFYTQHSAKNNSIASRRRDLAATNGKTSTIDPNVLYSPPRDLRTQKYFAFIVPKTFKEGQDPRRFMIYGETEAEYEAKRLAVEQKYGKDYRVLTKKDTQEYKEALGEYADGSIFDEMEFDSKMFNKGRSSELFPNTDASQSATLERYRTWTIKQEESLLRAGVELRYDGVVSGLRRMDDFYRSVEDSTLDKTWREPATIWKDTLSTMVNARARGSNLESMWVRVNDYMGEKGSQFIERTLSGLSKNGSKQLDQRDLAEFNKKLEDAGYQSPFDNVMQVALSSPDTVKSNAFPAAVKTLSNLISTLMLRLDPANSILQLVSTPILMLPVLQEAKISLRNTEAGQRLKAATGVTNPATGEVEPTTAKLMMNATRAFWSDEGKVFIQEMKDRNIISDHLSQYLQVTDMSQLNGRHAMKAVNDKIDQVAYYGSKVSGHNFAEEFSRFLVAHAVRDLAEIRGLPREESWALISGAVDKVHGVYAGAQRPQLFQGVLGQSVGLYQTYFFNFAQNLLKYTADGGKKQALSMAALQTSIFGIQSLPGFQALNNMIGKTNSQNEDLYTLSNADDPESASQYAMYGLASHMFGTPIDFTTRGSLTARNMLVIPTQFQDLPIVGTLAKAYGNMRQVAQNATDENVPTSQALLHGLAHNAMNRPLQGVASIVLGNVTTNEGQVNWMNSNYVGYNVANDLNWGAMFARAIGTRPLNETIVQSAYFRNAEYKANYRRGIADIGGQIQLAADGSALTSQSYGDFAIKYEQAGGEIQNFNAYWGRQLKAAGDGAMNAFQEEMMKGKDSSLGRAVQRMELKQSTLTPWDTDY